MLRRDRNPVSVYLFLMGGYTFLLTLVVSVNLVYQTQQVGLNPLQLVLVGTVMEATIFLCEMPTGVVADVYGRRISVIIGLVLMGAGMIVTGAIASFETILVGQIIWGFGATFISGAQQAWIADEVGAGSVGPVFLRSAQVEPAVRLVAIPVSIVIATYQLNLPILIGGSAFIGLGAVMVLLMSERGFQRPERQATGIPWSDFTNTFTTGGRMIKGSPLLLTVVATAAFYGGASEGFDRLWVAHFFTDLGFPTRWDLEPVIWIGVIRWGAAILSIVAVEIIRRRKIDTTSHSAVTRVLLLITVLQVSTLALFGAATGFVTGMLGFWFAVALSRLHDPLYLTWINQNVDSRVRATVISMSSQTDAIGQMTCGPVLGAIGSIASLRAALFASAVCLTPSVPLFLRAFRQKPEERVVNDAGAS